MKNPPANAGDVGGTDSIPGSGRSPGGGHGSPLQYSCWRIPWTEEPSGLQSTASQSQTRLSNFTFTFFDFPVCQAPGWGLPMHFLPASQSESYELFLSPIWWENSGFESLLNCCLKAIERRLLNSPIPGSGQAPSLLCASALKWPELKGRRGTGQWPAREDLLQSGRNARAPGKSTS